jgi:hypothetical protein
MPWPGQVNLRGLRPLLGAEFQWGLFAHTQQPRPTHWDVGSIQKLINTCRAADMTSLTDLETDGADRCIRSIGGEIARELWRVYRTPTDARAAPSTGSA